MSAKLTTSFSMLGELIKAQASAPSSLQAGRTSQFGRNYNETLTFNGTSTPAIDLQPVELSGTIPGGGNLDFDLTAAPDAVDIADTVDLSLRRLIAIQLSFGVSNNVAGVTLGPLAPNGYALFGGSVSLVLGPGTRLQQAFFGAASLRDQVGASDKDIRFAGTSGDTFKCLLYFGKSGV